MNNNPTFALFYQSNTNNMRVAKKSILGILAGMLIFSTLWSQDEMNLRVQITNIKHVEGHILIALHNTDETFLGENPFRSASAEVVEKGSLVVQIPKVPAGHYAISVFHDKNDNGKLDTKIFGIPKEPYGFSNDARKKLRAPRFDEALFELKESGQVEIVRVK